MCPFQTEDRVQRSAKDILVLNYLNCNGSEGVSRVPFIVMDSNKEQEREREIKQPFSLSFSSCLLKIDA